MKKWLLLVTMGLLAVFLTGCGDENNASVRIVHASPDAPNVDASVNGKSVASNLPYGEGTDYVSVSSGSRRVTVSPTGTSTNVIDTTTDFQGDTDYTILATGVVADIQPLKLTDDNSAPGSGNVKVRIVHGAPSAGTVDVYVTAPGADLNATTATLSGVVFRDVSDYQEVSAGSYQIRVTLAGTKTVAIDSGTVTLNAGQIRTVVALDAAGGGGPFQALVLADRN
jgi:hypothetical protein